MKTKIIPFDLERAKKIQSEEIEGRIVTREGNAVRIVCWDVLDKNFPIIALCKNINRKNEIVLNYTNDGFINIGKLEDELDLVIELPEETPEQYLYDKVKDKITDADKEEAKKTFPGSYNMQSAFISGIAYQICKEIDCKKYQSMSSSCLTMYL